MTKKRAFREFISYLVVIMIAVAFSLTIRIFVFEPFVVPTPSMEPALLVEDKVIVNKLSYRFAQVKRGDLVVFRSPTGEGKDLVKRAVGLPGEEITLTLDGEVYVNGHLLYEEYVLDSNTVYNDDSIILSDDEFFVLGDNRNNSLDSRFFGPVDQKEIFGKLVIIYWPPHRIKKV